GGGCTPFASRLSSDVSCATPLAGRLLLLMGLSGVEPLTSRLSGVRSNHLSYRPQRTYLSYSVQSVPQSVPQLSVSDRLLVLTDAVLHDLRPMLHLPEMPIHLLDHRRGRVPDLPRHRKGRDRRPAVRGLNAGTDVGVPEHLGRDLALRPARALGHGIKHLADVRDHPSSPVQNDGKNNVPGSRSRRGK